MVIPRAPSNGARALLIAALAVGAACATAGQASAAGEPVAIDKRIEVGTVVVRTKERRLYLVVSQGRALRYVVGVGRSDRQWKGDTRIEGKFIRPNWAPPDAVRKDNPSLPETISGDSPRNPMGAAALTLTGGEYAIHGTNTPKSIGGFVSYGCIRMHNDDIMELYRRVPIGARVSVRG